jgi:hypothetical protein
MEIASQIKAKRMLCRAKDINAVAMRKQPKMDLVKASNSVYPRDKTQYPKSNKTRSSIMVSSKVSQ